MKETMKTVELEAPAINGVYTISQGSDAKWHVTIQADIYRNGGQNATESEHPKGFSSMSYARKWAYKHHEKLSLTI